MNMIYLAGCFCHLQFLSLVSYSFLGTDCLPPWLDLSYFVLFVNKIISFISLSDSSLVAYRSTTNFVH